PLDRDVVDRRGVGRQDARRTGHPGRTDFDQGHTRLVVTLPSIQSLNAAAVAGVRSTGDGLRTVDMPRGDVRPRRQVLRLDHNIFVLTDAIARARLSDG